MRHFILMVMLLLTAFLMNTTPAWSEKPRFVDLGDGTMLDTDSGLCWLKNTYCVPAQLFPDAKGAAAATMSGICGLSDGSVAGQWSLPTIEQLKSLTAEPDSYRKDSLMAAGFQNICVGSDVNNDFNYY